MDKSIKIGTEKREPMIKTKFDRKLRNAKEYIKKVYYAIINKEIEKVLTVDEAWTLFKFEYDKGKDSIGKNSSLLKSKLWAEWFTLARPRIVEIMNKMDADARRKEIAREEKEILRIIANNKRGNAILEKFLNCDDCNDIGGNERYSILVEWFELNQNDIVRIMDSRNLIPEKIIYKHHYNKPNGEIKRLIAKDNFQSRQDLKKQEYELYLKEKK